MPNNGANSDVSNSIGYANISLTGIVYLFAQSSGLNKYYLELSTATTQTNTAITVDQEMVQFSLEKIFTSYYAV